MGNLLVLLWASFSSVCEELLGELLHRYWQTKNKIIRRWVIVICRLDILSLSFCPLEGRWENNVLQVSWWLIWSHPNTNYMEQFVFRTLPNSSTVSPKELRNSSWQPRSLPICLVSTLHVFWILRIHMWDDCKAVVTNCSLRRFTMTLRTGNTTPLK